MNAGLDKGLGSNGPSKPHLPPIKGGFNFENFHRNSELLRDLTLRLPNAKKTGTTIVGLVFNGGVVLGADTRATAGDVVADKNCQKIHYIAPNIYCCGAGTAADTEFVTQTVSSKLAMHVLNSSRPARVATALTFLKQHLFRYQGHIGAALILGGIDVTGPGLFTVYPHGSTDRLPYVTMGSGSLAAMSIFERGWREKLSREEAIGLVSEAIQAGIFNDLGSGSNVDCTVITKEGVEVLRNMVKPNPKPKRIGSYSYPRGKTGIISKQQLGDLVTITPGDVMDTS